MKDNAGSGRIAGLTERMRRISIASLAVLMFIEVLLAGCASSRTASTDARVDPAFAAWNRPDSPGCGVGVSRNGAVIYERIPAAVMGRVTTLTSAVSWSLIPLGGIVGGLLAEGVGIGAALVILGLVYFAATMLPLAVPAFRQFDRQPLPV